MNGASIIYVHKGITDLMMMLIELEFESFNLLKEIPHEELKIVFAPLFNTLRQAAGQS